MTDAFDDLSLAPEVVDAQLAEPVAVAPPSDPWLARRLLTVGASEVAVALVIAGQMQIGDLPGYLRPHAKLMKVGKRTAPRLVLQKAGLKEPFRLAALAARIGSMRERELLVTWQGKLERGEYYCDAEALIDARTIAHADSVPEEWLPLVSRYAPMAATPDAWARDVDEQLVNVQLKCSRRERRELPWYWRAQVVAECDATGAAWGLLVCGQWWSVSETSAGPIVAWPVEPTPAETERIRSAVRHFWTLVEGLEESDGTQ